MNIYKRPFDDQRQMRIHLETLAITMIFSFIEGGALSALWSHVLDYENSFQEGGLKSRPLDRRTK